MKKVKSEYKYPNSSEKEYNLFIVGIFSYFALILYGLYAY